MNFKVVVSDPKTRKAYQREVDQNASGLIGKKIGDTVKGDFLGLSGYELQITGGSDKDGFPMRKDIQGTARKKVLLAFPPGFHPKRKGQRKKKSVRGNTISQDITQVNVKIVKYGQKPIEQLFKIEKKAEKEAEKAEEKPKEEAKTEEGVKEEEKVEGKEKTKEKAEEKPETKEKIEETKPKETEEKKEAKETEPEKKEEAKPEETKKKEETESQKEGEKK